MKKIMLLLAASVSLSACSSGGGDFAPDKFSAADMCVVKLSNEEEKICYGMDRLEAEEIAGPGEATIIGSIEYESGLDIKYRDDIVALIRMTADSKGVYRTARGSEVWDKKSEIIDLYGKKHPWNESEKNLEYVYDIQENKFLDRTSGETIMDEQTHQFSATFNDRGEAETIMLLDRKMAMLLK